MKIQVNFSTKKVKFLVLQFPLRDKRKTICTAGYSEKLGLIRIYPTFWQDGIHNWEIVSIKLVADRRDSREESWKREKSSKFIKVGSISHDKRRKEELLESIYEEICTKDLNEARRSLTIIKPAILETNFIDIDETADKGSITQSLLDFFGPSLKRRAPLKVKSDFSYVPYITFRCGSSCKTQKPHHQQILEWGIYKWMEKNPNKIEQAWDNLRLFDSEYYKYFLLGNLRDQRTTWVIISVLRGKKSKDLKLKKQKKIVFKRKPESRRQKKLV